MTERGGTNGAVEHIYNTFHYGNKIANEEVCACHLYLEESTEGDMDLYFTFGSYYYKDNILLFDQASMSYMHYRKYTNWWCWVLKIKSNLYQDAKEGVP